MDFLFSFHDRLFFTSHSLCMLLFSFEIDEQRLQGEILKVPQFYIIQRSRLFSSLRRFSSPPPHLSVVFGLVCSTAMHRPVYSSAAPSEGDCLLARSARHRRLLPDPTRPGRRLQPVAGRWLCGLIRRRRRPLLRPNRSRGPINKQAH